MPSGKAADLPMSIGCMESPEMPVGIESDAFPEHSRLHKVHSPGTFHDPREGKLPPSITEMDIFH